MLHSDLGSQYTSSKFESLLAKYELKHSYSQYDNTSMESFNSILKKEEVNRKNYATFDEARIAIFKYIEGWYNNNRIHSSIGNITPNEQYKKLS